MANDTAIQWCDDTVNPTMGCEGCELWTPKRRTCYAGVLHQIRGSRNPGFAPTFEQVTLFPGRVARTARRSDLRGRRRHEKPWLDGQPRLIFVSDMSDALSSTVPFEYLTTEVIYPALSPEGQRHRWLWLTKRPDRMAAFSAYLRDFGVTWPSNVWAGTSITAKANLSRIDQLLEVGDAKTLHFLSVEPQAEQLLLSSWLRDLDWIIQGGESGREARPFDVAWARSLRDECAKRRVPYFLKQLGVDVIDGGTKVSLRHSHGGDWTEWPEELLTCPHSLDQA